MLFPRRLSAGSPDVATEDGMKVHPCYQSDSFLLQRADWSISQRPTCSRGLGHPTCWTLSPST